jgi:hypothetical protein
MGMIMPTDSATCPYCGTTAYPDVVRRRECCETMKELTKPQPRKKRNTVSRENDESNANYRRIQRAEDGHRE